MAGRSCEDCRTFVYDLETGQRKKDRKGAWLRRPPAPPGVLTTPCHQCPKVPTDAPEKHWRHAQDLNPRSLRILQHYRECKAVGQFPDDPLVRRHAALIRELEDQCGPGRLLERVELLLALLTQRRP